MEFLKYQHVERFGTSEVQNIELGECYVFPKIDGTNASVWMRNGCLCAGSRNRELTLDNDNAGFLNWVSRQPQIISFLTSHPHLRLYGEWLVPHSIKTYRDAAWRNFYVFDVAMDKTEEEMRHPNDTPVKYLHYNEYAPMLALYGIRYIPPLSIINKGSYEQFINQLAKNVYLMEDGKGAGEGVVIKRYDFENKYGRRVWAKIVTSEFKEKHAITMGNGMIQGHRLVEEEIARKYVTAALVEKEYAKIDGMEGWTSRMIPRLLQTVYYSVVTEEVWNFVKEHKNPTLDFKRLQHFIFAETKDRKPEYFGISSVIT